MLDSLKKGQGKKRERKPIQTYLPNAALWLKQTNDVVKQTKKQNITLSRLQQQRQHHTMSSNSSGHLQSGIGFFCVNCIRGPNSFEIVPSY